MTRSHSGSTADAQGPGPFKQEGPAVKQDNVSHPTLPFLTDPTCVELTT
jgi:hypothetical protein